MDTRQCLMRFWRIIQKALIFSVTSFKMGTEADLTFSIVLNKNSSMESLIKALSELNKNLKIEIVGSNHVLDL